MLALRSVGFASHEPLSRVSIKSVCGGLPAIRVASSLTPMVGVLGVRVITMLRAISGREPSPAFHRGELRAGAVQLIFPNFWSGCPWSDQWREGRPGIGA
jgi:hypothetical protein